METLKKIWNTFMYADQDYEPWDLVFATVMAFSLILGIGSSSWTGIFIFIVLFPITYRSVAARLAQRKVAKLSEEPERL
jgi:hypothetical protein